MNPQTDAVKKFNEKNATAASAATSGGTASGGGKNRKGAREVASVNGESYD